MQMGRGEIFGVSRQGDSNTLRETSSTFRVSLQGEPLRDASSETFDVPLSPRRVDKQASSTPRISYTGLFQLACVLIFGLINIDTPSCTADRVATQKKFAYTWKSNDAKYTLAIGDFVQGSCTVVGGASATQSGDNLTIQHDFYNLIDDNTLYAIATDPSCQKGFIGKNVTFNLNGTVTAVNACAENAGQRVLLSVEGHWNPHPPAHPPSHPPAHPPSHSPPSASPHSPPSSPSASPHSPPSASPHSPPHSPPSDYSYDEGAIPYPPPSPQN